MPEVPEKERALTPAEAAAALGVAPHTLLRLEAAGRVGSFRTPGGSRRYPAAAVEALRRERAGALTTAEAAALLRVHPDTVGRYARAGKLVPVPGLGRSNWFRADEVRALAGPGDSSPRLPAGGAAALAGELAAFGAAAEEARKALSAAIGLAEAAEARADAAEARITEALEVTGNFLAQYGNSDIPMFKAGTDLANSIRKILGGREAPHA